MISRSTAALIAATVIAALAAFGTASALAAPGHGKLKISSLSSDPDLVTGGNALVAVDVPDGVKTSQVQVRRNGDNVTKAFDTRAGEGAIS